MTEPSWSTQEARRKLARDAARAPYADQCCPNCGAAAYVALLDLSDFTTYRFIVEKLECSDQCWERDPQAYIDAVKRSEQP